MMLMEINDAGHVRIYEWNGSSWVQQGQDIDGEAADDWSGSVSMNAAGDRVAIGANIMMKWIKLAGHVMNLESYLNVIVCDSMVRTYSNVQHIFLVQIQGVAKQRYNLDILF